MNDELIITLIVSLTSLLVALISLITSIIGNRNIARSGLQIERLKNEFSRQEAKEKLLDVQFTESQKSLQAAIRAIQQVKDEVQLILSATRASMDSKTAIEYIGIARQDIFECYEVHLANLNNEEAELLHEAKNYVLDIEKAIVDGLQSEVNASSLSKVNRERVVELRELITDRQERLRDSRSNRLINRLENA